MQDLPIEFRRVKLPKLPPFTRGAVAIGIAAIVLVSAAFSALYQVQPEEGGRRAAIRPLRPYDATRLTGEDPVR